MTQSNGTSSRDLSNSGPEFVIRQEFDASREKLWKAWTERDELAQWFTPKGLTLHVARHDLRPGGHLHSCMKTPDGKEMWGKFEYVEVSSPHRLVYVTMFSDAAGGITRHPLQPNWPARMLTTLTFEDMGGNRSGLTLRWSPMEPSPQEQATFDSSHESMRNGWTGTFGQLTEYLAHA